MKYLILISLLFGAYSHADADSLRCGQQLIKVGDSQADVEKRCGSPNHKDKGQESVLYQRKRQQLKVQRWYYTAARGRLNKVVIFYRGEVVMIKKRGRR